MEWKSALALTVALTMTLGFVASSNETAESHETPRLEIQADPAACCFRHAELPGVCEVVPAEDETCSSILEYLNTPMSADKTYCGSTEIRGGWESVRCEED